MQQSIQTINAHKYQIQELKFIDDINLTGPWIAFTSSAQLL